MSGGRLILGVGSGAADDPVFTVVGTPMTAPERAAKLDEGLQILIALWTGTAVRHHGRCYRIDGLQPPGGKASLAAWGEGCCGRRRSRSVSSGKCMIQCSQTAAPSR